MEILKTAVLDDCKQQIAALQNNIQELQKDLSDMQAEWDNHLMACANAYSSLLVNAYVRDPRDGRIGRITDILVLDKTLYAQISFLTVTKKSKVYMVLEEHKLFGDFVARLEELTEREYQDLFFVVVNNQIREVSQGTQKMFEAND